MTSLPRPIVGVHDLGTGEINTASRSKGVCSLIHLLNKDQLVCGVKKVDT